MRRTEEDLKPTYEHWLRPNDGNLVLAARCRGIGEWAVLGSGDLTGGGEWAQMVEGVRANECRILAAL